MTLNKKPNIKMITVYWRFLNIPKSLLHFFISLYQKCRLTIYSLMYNHFLDQSYAADVCMGPMFWFVDNFTNVVGALLVIAVVALTAVVVLIAYWIGIPYWWERNWYMCIFLLAVGHWLLLNIVFHYYMAVTTLPGYPPQGELIPEAVSICKKCISPKPPRTHHCSVCNRCILKMDHHCPWLNNCVGFENHRYFYMYMVYMVVGVLFVIIAGFDIAYTSILNHSDYDDAELEGHSVKINKTGALIPVTDTISLNRSIVEDEQNFDGENPWRRKAIIFMALINFGVFVALGSLAAWHAQLIGKGETSIEAHINKAEAKRMTEIGRNYKNPYNFGTRKNWRIFLGTVQGRSFMRHILLPSAHRPVGDGLTWHTIHDEPYQDDWP